MAANEGSVQKLPNGNYLICTGGVSFGGFRKKTFSNRGSVLYEISASGSVLWELSNFGTSCEGVRYAYGYLDGVSSTAQRKKTSAAQNTVNIRSYPRVRKVSISMNNADKTARLSLYSLTGREVVSSVATNDPDGWNLSTANLPTGLYIFKIVSGTTVYWNQVAVQH
jgi:hypothetical protein